MRLTFIRPNMGRLAEGPYIDEGRMEPLQLAVLAAMCPPDVDVSLFDDRCEEIPFDHPADLIAITVETFTARRAYEISAEFRSRGVPVVIGGFHPTLIPEEATEHADVLVLGDAESVWEEVIRDAANGKLKRRYEGVPGIPQSGVLPRRDLFRGKDYLPVALSQFGRGCINGCEYCAISSFFAKTHRCRPVREVVEEIEKAGRKLIFFVDDNIVADPEGAKALFRALIPLRIKWVSQGTVDMVHDPELMELMCASGCLGNVIGFESLSRKNLAAMGKNPNLRSSDLYAEEVELLRSYGLQTWAAFMVGHDDDTRDSLYDLSDFAQQNKFTFAAFNVVVPYPRTPLYAKLKEEGRLLYEGHWWKHPDFRFNYAPFKPANMSAEELTEIAFDLRRRWNTPSSIVKRFFEPRTNMGSLYRMGVYWTYNPIFRREVFRKQGLLLGEKS